MSDIGQAFKKSFSARIHGKLGGEGSSSREGGQGAEGFDRHQGRPVGGVVSFAFLQLSVFSTNECHVEYDELPQATISSGCPFIVTFGFFARRFIRLIIRVANDAAS